jgi:hypothetical protein
MARLNDLAKLGRTPRPNAGISSGTDRHALAEGGAHQQCDAHSLPVVPASTVSPSRNATTSDITQGA